MVPGVFKQVIPCLMASPLRGRTCTSYPLGISINMRVGIKTLSRGKSCRGSSRKALISIPEEPSVAYAGKSLVDLLTILTSITGIVRKDNLFEVEDWVFIFLGRSHPIAIGFENNGPCLRRMEATPARPDSYRIRRECTYSN